MNDRARRLCEALAEVLRAHPGAQRLSVSLERDYLASEDVQQVVLRVEAATDVASAELAALLGAAPPQFVGGGTGARWLVSSSASEDRACRVVIEGPLHHADPTPDAARIERALDALGTALPLQPPPDAS